VLPFNNISSSLLLERDFFKTPPDHCTLTIPNQCQSSSNPPTHCPSSDTYQPPLPINITINGKYYDELESSDIDCGDDDWSKGCTKVLPPFPRLPLSSALLTLRDSFRIRNIVTAKKARSAPPPPSCPSHISSPPVSLLSSEALWIALG
jgi:hypothetical protein